jgi:hypothetical protein
MTALRRLAAILAADVAGYSRLMGADEEGTLERLKACYAHMGRLEEARALVERLRALGAVVVPDHRPLAGNPAHNELYLSGLRLAAGEAT